MRSILLPKPLLTAALGSVVVLAAVGTQSAHATTTASARASAVPAASRPSPARTARAATAVTSARKAEARFLELADLIAQRCEPNVLGAVGQVPSAPAPDRTLPVLSDPVPLTPAEECAARTHQLRISRAFSGRETATYAQMRDRLTALTYPGARIHRMPDFGGEPVVRLDLRVGAEHLALEVTGLGNGVMVRAFGAPQFVSVTEVPLEREVDWPTS
ncbi:hypothetical protein [Streptomyces sp. R44]|uniref:Uncharacterized protein n=1 Tax=Streptomyces sp. R44 TaxID=3238633 RepID=A0AB39T6V6_9ACTN